MSPLRSAPGRATPARSHGYTIAELLIAGTISAILMGAIAIMSLSQIRWGNNFYTTATLTRRFNSFSNLLRAEIKDACLLRADSDPLSTTCTPQATSECGNLDTGVSDPAVGADLRMRVMALDPATNTTSYPIIRYYRSGTNLLRDGPEVGNDGALTTPATTVVGKLVMNNVSDFAVTVAPDCSWATITLTLTLPGTTTTQQRVFTQYVGSPTQV